MQGVVSIAVCLSDINAIKLVCVIHEVGQSNR